MTYTSVCSSYFFSPPSTLCTASVLVCVTPATLVSDHWQYIESEQVWAYFSPSPSGKRCVHKVTVDYFLGKRQSQGGVADKCIFVTNLEKYKTKSNMSDNFLLIKEIMWCFPKSFLVLLFVVSDSVLS